MAIVSKDMGSIVVAAGTLKVTLFYDNTVIDNAAKIPSAADSFMNFGDVVEKLDDSAGIIQIGEMSFALREDYTNYIAGVWYTLFVNGSETQFRFYLDEGAGDTFLFWGYVPKQKGAVTAKELYVANPGASGTYIRRLTVKLLSLQRKILDASVSDFEASVKAANYESYNSSTDTYNLSFRRFFTSFIKTAFGSSGYDQDASVDFPTSGNAVIQLWDALANNWKSFADCLIFQKTGSTFNLFFNGLSTVTWSKKYSTCKEILKVLCFQFGVVPTYNYDIVNNRHVLILRQRGRDGNFLIFNNTEHRPAEWQLINDINIDRAKAFRATDETFYSADIPSADSYDTSLPVFFLNASSVGVFNWYEQFTLYDPASLAYPSKMRYYNKSSAAMIEGEGTATDHNDLINIYKYYQSQFSTFGIFCSRSYRGIKASDDGGSTYKHTVVYPGCRTQIHDGISNKNFYANEVKKNVSKNEMKITWVQE